jgi:hypothetical protein
MYEYLKSISFHRRFIPTNTINPPFQIIIGNPNSHIHLKQKGGLLMLNSVVLTGNLGGDPKIHFISGGEPIASFNLAFKAARAN